jgi:hypothetical protein
MKSPVLNLKIKAWLVFLDPEGKPFAVEDDYTGKIRKSMEQKGYECIGCPQFQHVQDAIDYSVLMHSGR